MWNLGTPLNSSPYQFTFNKNDYGSNASIELYFNKKKLQNITVKRLFL